MAQFFGLTLTFSLLLLPAIAASAEESSITLTDIRGREVRPLDCGDETRAAVVIFTTTDCPVANSYAPEINRIAQSYASKGVGFTLVHVDPDLTENDARKHARDYGLEGISMVIDRRHVLVKATGATMTPEAAVIAPGGKIAYLGRINDLYAGYGDKRSAAMEHNLRDAIDAVLAGKPVQKARVPAIGCDIPDQ